MREFNLRCSFRRFARRRHRNRDWHLGVFRVSHILISFFRSPSDDALQRGGYLPNLLGSKMSDARRDMNLCVVERLNCDRLVASWRRGSGHFREMLSEPVSSDQSRFRLAQYCVYPPAINMALNSSLSMMRVRIPVGLSISRPSATPAMRASGCGEARSYHPSVSAS